MIDPSPDEINEPDIFKNIQIPNFSSFPLKGQIPTRISCDISWRIDLAENEAIIIQLCCCF